MKILLTGATGFIGRHLLADLLDGGHDVVCAVRRRPAPDTARCRWLPLDLARATPDAWAAALRGIDAVANLVDILRERDGETFEALHVRGPIVLFDACLSAGVRRVVQVSSLGADDDAQSAYHLSKCAADRHLLGLPLDGTVVVPSLVFGAGGASSTLFLTWASLPVLPLPGGGWQTLQPLHVDDLVQLLRRLLESPAGSWRRRVSAVGPQSLPLGAYLLILRAALGIAAPWRVPVPTFVMLLAARAGDLVPRMLFHTAAWQMLQRGQAADPADTESLLGRPPRPVARFVPSLEREAWRRLALLGWLLPLLRWALAALWFASGAVSLGLYPVDDSLRLLAQAGVPADWQRPALYGAALLDLLLGLSCLLPAHLRRPAWALQAVLVLFYSAVIALQLPEQWLHPFGPMTKNLPILALLWLLWSLEPPRALRH